MIVVSVQGASFAELAARASAARAEGDVVELRLDAPGAPHGALAFRVEELRALREHLGLPVLASLNDAEAFGCFTGPVDARRALLGAADAAGVDLVDVPWPHAAECGVLRARRVLSAHVPAEACRDAARRLVEHSAPGDLLKLVGRAPDAAAGLDVLQACAGHDWRGREHAVFASGAEAAWTRVVAPAFGSAAVWARAVDAPATAPGQLDAHALRAARPARPMGSATRLYAVLGDPIAHSLSPRLHGRALRELGIDAAFVSLRAARLDALLPLLDQRWRGLALTAPLKEQGARLADERDAPTRACDAANTLVRVANGAWRAANTDVAGLALAARAALGLAPQASLAGRAIAILGAGGAARAACHALAEARLSLWARDARAARACADARGILVLGDEASIEAELVVDCTSAALAGESPLPIERIAPRAVVLGGGAAPTVVMGSTYRPSRTPLLVAAESRGMHAVDGARWFLEQAIRQFELHHGLPAPRAAMEEELRAALSEEARP